MAEEENSTDLTGRVAARLSKDLDKLTERLGPEVTKQLKILIDKLASSNGVVLRSDYNKKIALQIERTIEKAFSKVGIDDILKQYLPALEEIETEVIDTQKEVNSIRVVRDPALNQFALETFQTNLIENGVKEGIAAPLRQAVARSILTGGTISSLEAELTKLSSDIVGNSFSRTLYDSLYQYEGTINQKIINDFGLNAILYSGPIVPTSRPQCRRWVKEGVILLSDLPYEIDWAFKNGNGMIPGTNEDNFAINRGGYRCAHKALPTKR